MALENVSLAVPEHLRNVLIEGEIPYHFSWTDLNKNAGCDGGQQAKSYMMISNKRVIYDASIKDNEKYKQESGSIPISKLSFVSVSTEKKSDGCNEVKFCLIKIGSGGGAIEIAIPSEEEARRLQKVISEVQAEHG